MITLVSLPLDVKSLIFGLITRRKDLKAIYSTCKDFYEIVIPRIYRSITLNEDIEPRVLCAALSPENRGLRYVRHLTVLPARSAQAQSYATYDFALELLANQLPRDVLLSFNFEMTRLLSADTMESMYRRQRRLRTYRQHDSLVDCSNAVFCGISTLQILITDDWCLDYARECLLVCSNLEHFEVRVDMKSYCLSEQLKPKDEQDRARASEKMFAVLIGSRDIDGAKSHEDEVWNQKCLKTLRFHGFNASGTAARFTDAINIEHLESLSLQCCEKETSLLRVLAADESNLCNNLQHLAIMQSLDSKTCRKQDGAIDDLLKSFRGLKSLVISAPNALQLRPDLTAVLNHRSTIESLYLDCAPDESDFPEDCFYDFEEMEQELKACPRLTQLALDFPSIPLLSLDTCYADWGDLRSLVSWLSEMPRLRAVQMLNLPILNLIESEEGHIAVRCGLRAYAEYLFKQLDTVTAVAIGKSNLVSQKIGDLEVKRHFYTRGTLVDLHGETSVAAVETNRTTLREMEPMSDILDIEPAETRWIRYGQTV